MLGRTGSLERADVLLAGIAALAAVGGARFLLRHALRCGLDAASLREALLVVATDLGALRTEQAFEALEDAVREHEEPEDPFAAAALDASRPPLARAQRPPVAWAADDEPSSPARPSETAPPAEARTLASEGHARRARLSRTFARWVEEDRARSVARAGRSPVSLSSPRSQALARLGAAFPVEAPAALAEAVDAVRSLGVSSECLWALHDVLAKLFHAGEPTKAARLVFQRCLGVRFEADEDRPRGRLDSTWG